MKKCYKAPELEMIFVDTKEVIADSIHIGEGEEGEENSAQYRESYRSSLWND